LWNWLFNASQLKIAYDRNTSNRQRSSPESRCTPNEKN
jgi:hypothetical protein